MSQTYTLCEVKINNGKNGKPIWVVIKGGVYDLTNFVQEHPGGKDTIMEVAGKDATKAFNQVGHSADAINDMKLYRIGTVATECTQYLQNSSQIKSTTVITSPPNLRKNSDNSTSAEKSSAEMQKQCCGKPQDEHIKFFCCC